MIWPLFHSISSSQAAHHHKNARNQAKTNHLYMLVFSSNPKNLHTKTPSQWAHSNNRVLTLSASNFHTVVKILMVPRKSCLTPPYPFRHTIFCPHAFQTETLKPKNHAFSKFFVRCTLFCARSLFFEYHGDMQKSVIKTFKRKTRHETR